MPRSTPNSSKCVQNMSKHAEVFEMLSVSASEARRSLRNVSEISPKHAKVFKIIEVAMPCHPIIAFLKESKGVSPQNWRQRIFNIRSKSQKGDHMHKAGLVDPVVFIPKKFCQVFTWFYRKLQAGIGQVFTWPYRKRGSWVAVFTWPYRKRGSRPVTCVFKGSKSYCSKSWEVGYR